MLGKQYETANTQVECKETLYPDTHTMFCHKFIEKLTDTVEVIMRQSSLKEVMKLWKGKVRA